MEHHNSSFDYSNSTWDYEDDYDSWNYFVKLSLVSKVMNYIIVSLGIPLCAVAVYVLYSLVRHDNKPAPVYIINLLISDIIQICCLIVNITPFQNLWNPVFLPIYSFCLGLSVLFMACTALERYLLVAWPLWYRFKRPTRTSVVVSVLVWIFCAVVCVALFFLVAVNIFTVFGIFLLLPFPLLIFCLGGTLRALSSCRLPADEKRRIMAVLVLVLLIYTLIFLPTIITVMARGVLFLHEPPFILLGLNPLADMVLYIFMRKGAVDKLLASVCCCKLNNNDNSISSA